MRTENDTAPALSGAEAVQEPRTGKVASETEVSSGAGDENAARLFGALVCADREPELQSEILTAVSPGDFASPWHGQLWVRARTIAASGRAVDCVTLTAGMEAPEALDVARLAGGGVTSATWENSAAAIRTAAQRRRMLDAVTRAEAEIARGDPAAVARELAEAFTLEAQAGADGPEFAALGALPSVADGDPAELIRHRFLCRGGGCLLIGQTGYGKSSLILQLATAFTLGRPTLGLAPARALRCLVIQAENDPGDLAEVRDGLRAGLPQAGVGTLADVDTALARLHVLTVDTVSGDRFPAYLARALSRCPDGTPDLVFVDPLLAFYGADTSDQKAASAWLRAGLNPVIHRAGCGLILTHHTGKPASLRSQENAREAHDLDYAYLGLGSSEWPNWARAVLSLQAVRGADGIFTLRAGKRGRRLSWTDADGAPTVRRYLAHATEPGAIYWRDPAPGQLPADTGDTGRGGRPAKPPADYIESLLSMLRDAPLPVAEAKARLRADYGLGRDRAADVLTAARERVARAFLVTDKRQEYIGLPAALGPHLDKLRADFAHPELQAQTPETPAGKVRP